MPSTACTAIRSFSLHVSQLHVAGAVEDTWCCLAINFWVIGAENTWRRIAINF
jgi:hypothetical protein